MKIKQLAYGIATFVPGITKLRGHRTGGTDSGRYCYSVWLRHAVMAKRSGLNPMPRIVAELGPGDSLGIGLAALLSGAEKYYAFDVVRHANTERNLDVFEQLVELFRSKTDIPGDSEFPKVKPRLDSYAFPQDIYTDGDIAQSLKRVRIDRIRSSIIDPDRDDSVIQYRVPWLDWKVMERESVDMIFSQAVLEHVDDLMNTYRAMATWLKRDGFVSHQIDFKSHGMANEWNGHWAISDLNWRLIRGNRPYLLNREPQSTHISILNSEGFKIILNQPVKTTSNISRHSLASRFKMLSDDDLTTSDIFIQAVKAQ